MTEIFRPPYMQVETSAGVPVSGAKLHFYQAGTTTNITTYQDSGKVTPHANPVVADASGRFAAIYVDEATYKCVLKDADDVTLQTFDNINGTSASDEVVDNVFRVTGNLDTTKKVAFQVDGLTTGTTRTLTVPDASGTIVVTGGTDLPVADGGTGASTATDARANLSAIGFPENQGHIYGLTLTNNSSDASNDIDIAVGFAVDSGNTAGLSLAAAITKRMDATWVVGHENGGAFDSASNTTWYVYLIKRPDTGVVDVGFSTTDGDPTSDTNYPADYTLYRKIGSFARASAANKAPRTLSQKEATDWVAYTPVFTGFGTVSGVSMFSRRVGDTLEVMGKWTAGTATATEARISLGFNGVEGNLEADATKVASIRACGLGALSAVGSQPIILIESGVGYLTVGLQGGSAAGLTKVNGSTIGTGVTTSITASVPISGW